MARIRATAERIVDAEPGAVYAVLTDYSGGRRKMLPENYLDYSVVEADGDGAATLSYRLRAGGRERGYRMRVTPETGGRALVERDEGSSYTTRWTLTQLGPGAHTRVRVETEWESRAKGMAGFFERRFAPLGVRRIEQETLARLGQLAQGRQPGAAGR